MKKLIRFGVLSFVLSGLAAPALAQTTGNAAGNRPTSYPYVTFGVDSFLQYAVELHERDYYNAFDVTRGYLNIRAQMSDKISFRFTPDVKPTTDADLNRNLALRLEYAALDVQVTDNVKVMFGQHETPWLTFEESVNRYRVIGPFFSERLGLIPGPTDLGVSLKGTRGRTEYHAGVYNGEGYGRSELDKYKSIEGRFTARPFVDDGAGSSVSISGFYSYGWYANDRPRNVAIVMGTYEQPHVVATGQYLSATDNPFVARDVERSGMSFFGEVRQGLTGWAGVGRVDIFDPDASNTNDSRRRYVFGGAHWSQWGPGRLGLVVTLEQLFRTINSEKLESRLLAQTHVEF